MSGEERLVGHLILVGPGPVTVDQMATPPRARSRETGACHKEGHSSSIQGWHNINSPVPIILRQFPAEEEDQGKYTLANDVVYFCQPEGCGVELAGPSTHVFMLTDTETNMHTYGVCLTFPHLFDAHSTQEASSISAKSDAINIQQWGVLSVCILSHHPFFNFFAKCLKTLSHFMEHFEVLWNALILCSEGSLEKSGAQRKKRPPLITEIEEWIHNLLLLPVPEPGRCGLEVELEVGPEVLICYPPKNRLPLFDLRLCRLFQRIGVHIVIEVVKLILSEQKVCRQESGFAVYAGYQ